MSIFKSLRPGDVSQRPYKAYAKYSYVYQSGSTSNSPEFDFLYAEKYVENNEIVRVPNIKYDLFDSVLQSFYSPIPYTAYGTTAYSYTPEYSTYVISIPQTVFGEKIVPKTFSIILSSSKIEDDGKNNLVTYQSGETVGSVVGRIFYDKGVALVKTKDKPNINPDPLWTQGVPDIDGTGWEFLLATASTDTLGVAQGFLQSYPGRPTIAAKIGTRTGTYWSGGAFFTHSVATNEEYDISGWVYAGGTTYRAILNNRIPGSDQPMGYQLTYLDGSSNVIGYETIKTKEPTDTTSGDYGWVKLSKRIKITDPNIASFMIAAFIDGKYPYGYGYGSPPENPDIVCTPEQTAQGCPGYAWFAGFKIENVQSSPSVGIDNTGLYITGSMSLTTNFSSSVSLYENIIKVEIDQADYLYTNNPTAMKIPSGSTNTAAELMVKDVIKPYITTIGFYNENNDLLLVAKPSVPIQRTSKSPQTFIVKYDIS